MLNPRAIAIARTHRSDFALACAKRGGALLDGEARAKEALLAVLKDSRVIKFMEEESVLDYLFNAGQYRTLIRFRPYKGGQHLSGVHYGFHDEEDVKMAFRGMEKEWRGNVSVAFIPGSLGTEVIITVAGTHT